MRNVCTIGNFCFYTGCTTTLEDHLFPPRTDYGNRVQIALTLGKGRRSLFERILCGPQFVFESSEEDNYTLLTATENRTAKNVCLSW